MSGTRDLAVLAAEAAVDRLGEDVVVLDLGSGALIAQRFVIATAGSVLHAQALADTIEMRLREAGARPHHVEGVASGQWIILDYFDVVVHIFIGDVRRFYGLERLWGDAPTQHFPPGNQ